MLLNKTETINGMQNIEVVFTDDGIIDYKIWHREFGDIYYIPYTYDRIYPLEFLWNPSFILMFFNKYWPISFLIVALYVIAIFMIQKIMKERPPFQLRNCLILWNLFLAIFSFVGLFRFGQEFLYVLGKRSFQDSICLSFSPEGPAAFWALCFALSKGAELIDTIFIVLRKRPLIFLHWYHHATVLVYTWHAAKELAPAGRWFIFMNYFVHSLMYTYYTITSVGFRPPKCISMIVTMLQTMQMLVGVFIALFIVHLKIKSTFGDAIICQQSNENLLLSFVIYLSFAGLFINFFYSAYFFGKDKKASKLEACKFVQNGVAHLPNNKKQV